VISLLYETNLNTPLGRLGLLADDSCLIELSLQGLKGLSVRGKPEKERFKVEIEELTQYFSKKRNSFTFKIQIGGTDFQKSVFNSMKTIKYGKVLTYKELAAKIGKPKAYRAVGSACGANRIPIVIPCHRVVSSTGLGGFGGGLERKKFLLNLESN
jgi:methylated-DNA-[protein]-cysteine S-methyltransferase